jgi:outer membrane immunogenic protein
MMRNKLLCGVAAVAIAIGIGGPAMAADIATKAPPAPIPAPAPTWAGFYLGATVGYGWTKVTGGPSEFVTELKLSGGLVGIHSGYNFQAGQWVYGIETDYSGVFGRDWSNTKFSAPANLNSGIHAELNGLGSIRARLGWAIDRTLIYATGGVGYGIYKTAAQATEGIPPASGHTVWGGVLGAGVEWKYTQNFSFRLEGMNYFFNKKEAATSSTPGPVNGALIKNVALIRFGGSYHF